MGWARTKHPKNKRRSPQAQELSRPQYRPRVIDNKKKDKDEETDYGCNCGVILCDCGLL